MISLPHLRDELPLVGLVGVLDELDGELEVVTAVHAAALELQCECKESRLGEKLSEN